MNPSQQEDMQPSQNHSQPQNHNPTQDPPPAEVPSWCKCGKCRPMSQEVENKCCKQKNCITLSSRFGKLCLDPDVLELCIRNTSDIRNDKEDNSTRAFRKAAYRQFILARHGYLGKGNRRVCPSCAVLKIRERYPSITGVYMGYREYWYFQYTYTNKLYWVWKLLFRTYKLIYTFNYKFMAARTVFLTLFLKYRKQKSNFNIWMQISFYKYYIAPTSVFINHISLDNLGLF